MASIPTYGCQAGQSLDPVAVMLPDGSVRLYDSETDRVTARKVLAEFPDHDLFAASPSSGFELLSLKRVLKPGETYQIVPSNSVLLPPMQPFPDCFPSSASHFPMDLDAICSEMRDYDYRHIEQGACDFGPSISAMSAVDTPTVSGSVRDTDASTFATELRKTSAAIQELTLLAAVRRFVQAQVAALLAAMVALLISVAEKASGSEDLQMHFPEIA